MTIIIPNQANCGVREGASFNSAQVGGLFGRVTSLNGIILGYARHMLDMTQ